MDTKWKNIKQSVGLKMGAVGLAWSSLMVMAGGGMTLLVLRWYRHWQAEPTFQVFRWPMIIALPVFLASLTFLTMAAGHSARRRGEADEEGSQAAHREENDVLTPGPLDWLYTDMHTLLVMAAAGLSIGAAAVILGMARDSMQTDNFTILALLVVLGIDGCIGLAYYLSMVRHIKRRTFFHHTLLASFMRSVRGKISRLFSYERAHVTVMMMVLAFGLVNGMLGAVFSFQGMGLMMVLAVFNATVLVWLLKPLTSYAAILQASHHIAQGEVEYPLHPEQMATPLQELGKNITGIQRGLKQAVGEAVKGERMKTELITNVSHDLKTPLTSIVNYVDLLKQEKLDNEKAQEYLLVLEEKAERLKQLIEDLMEASKASSGNVSVQLETLNLNEILLQVEGEYRDKLTETGLELQVIQSEAPVQVSADGSCLRRIMENLMNNVAKYSLPGTRVYISAENGRQEGSLTVKNVSATQLNMNPETLMERFVRGDESRSEEGSGLGLAIAKGLAQAQQGNLEIAIDGDLFKTVLSLPAQKEGHRST